MPSQDHASNMEKNFEPISDPQKLTYNKENPRHNAPTDVDYEPHPESSLPLSPSRQQSSRPSPISTPAPAKKAEQANKT